jgi:hypothetical protein
MADNNPYAVPFHPPQYAPGKQFTVSGQNRKDKQELYAAIARHINNVDKKVATGQHASPHARQARKAAWKAHEEWLGLHQPASASKQAQEWIKNKAEQQEIRTELNILRDQVAELQKKK